jgi:hypothetical protein
MGGVGMREESYKPTSLRGQTIPLLEISTAHITQRDGELIEKEDCPGRQGGHDESYGSWFHVSPDDSLAQFFVGVLDPMQEFGLSPYFRTIILQCRLEGITRVYFDVDAPVIKDLKTFDW